MYVLAGANGSGKSTLYADKIAPVIKAPFHNADVIQKTELKVPDPAASLKAARIAAERIQGHIKNKTSFVRETVFSHPSKLDEIRQAKAAGFQVALYHVGLDSENLNVKRVGLRVKKGGHDVPENKIRERRERGKDLIAEAARLSDHAFVYDNSKFGQSPKLGITFRKGQVVRVGENLPKWQRDLYSSDLSRFLEARLNPAAASYNLVDQMAKDHANSDKVRASIPKKGMIYAGKLIGESALHYLQITSDLTYVAHFKKIIGDSHKMGSAKEIKYQTRHKADVIDIR